MKMRFILFIITILFISCEKELEDKEYGLIKTLHPTQIDETGVTFRGELLQNGSQKISSYGFTWSTEDPNIKTSKKIILGNELNEGQFQSRIDFSISSGLDYNVRAFINYGDQTVYGNAVTFHSKGSLKSAWKKESNIVFSSSGKGFPYAWADEQYGYILFPSGETYRFNPESQQLALLGRLRESGRWADKYTGISFNKNQYMLGSRENRLYNLDNNNYWEVKSFTTFNYSSNNTYELFCSNNDQLYLIKSLKSFSYNFNNNTWSEKRGFSGHGVAGAKLNGYAFILNDRKKIKKYDFQTDRWSTATDFPGTFSDNPINFPDGTKMIGFANHESLFFGFGYSDGLTQIETTIWCYHEPTNFWSEIEDFPLTLKVGKYFYFVLKEKLYIGYHEDSDIFSIYSLDLNMI